MPLRFLAFVGILILAAACGDEAEKHPEDVPDSTEHVPPNSIPCKLPERWPHSLASEEHPFLVHFREARDRETAKRVVGILDYAWKVEVDDIGFRPPVDDGDACGPDGRYDVFLWRDHGDAYVDVLGPNPETWWDDQRAYMVVDAWGPYAGPILDSTLAHEFNHACQAAYDWYDAGIIYESSAVFMEDVVYDDDNEFKDLLYDFQKHPDWSLDRNDKYATWYMYSASLFLFYVRDRFYDGNPGFLPEMWERMRNEPGAARDQSKNEPDFEDAVDAMLRDKAGVSYLEAVTEFARWRYFTGDRDDGKHFEEGATFPPDARVKSQSVTLDGSPVTLDLDPMLLGSAYVDVEGPKGSSASVVLDSKATGVRWIVQAVPGLDPGSDGDLLDVEGGDRLRLGPEGRRTLVVLALPAGKNDPDARTDARFLVSVTLAP